MDVSGRSVKAQFKVADREHAAYCVVVGESELAAGSVVLKDLTTGEQTTVPRDDLPSRLSR
jgi:histidyl-tRNA synthetase